MLLWWLCQKCFKHIYFILGVTVWERKSVNEQREWTVTFLVRDSVIWFPVTPGVLGITAPCRQQVSGVTLIFARQHALLSPPTLVLIQTFSEGAKHDKNQWYFMNTFCIPYFQTLVSMHVLCQKHEVFGVNRKLVTLCTLLWCWILMTFRSIQCESVFCSTR